MVNYFSNPANLLTYQKALFNTWYTSTLLSAIPATSYGPDSYQFTANGTLYMSYAAVPFMLSILPGQTYTFGVTKVTGTATITLQWTIYNGATYTSIATGSASGTANGRISVTFNSPVTDIDMRLQIAIIVSGYTAPVIVKGASLTYSATDIGELSPVLRTTDDTVVGGFDLRLVIYNPGGARRKILQGADNIAISFVLSDVGALTFTMNKTLPDYSLIDTDWAELAVEFTTDGVSWEEPRGGRFVKQTETEDDVEIYGDKKFEFSSIGTFWRKMPMAKGTIDANGLRQFSATVGTVLRTIITEKQTAGCCTGITFDFTNTQDSSGTSWSGASIVMGFKPGYDVLSMLTNFSDQDIIEWTTMGRALQVYNNNGYLNRDLSASIVYRGGFEIIKADTQGTNENRCSRVNVYSEDNTVVTLTNAGAITPYGHLEATVSDTGTVNNNATMTRLGNAELNKGAAKLYQRTLTMNYSRANKFPFVDFDIGCTIGVFTKPNQTTPSKFRVKQITLSKKGADGILGNLILDTRFELPQVNQVRKTKRVVNGVRLR